MKRLFDLESPLMSGLIKLFDCICLSVLWLVCCIPLVTAGAASAALYTTVFKYIRREEGTLAATYFGAFKENFRRSTLAGLVSLALLAVLVLDALVFRSLRLSGSAMGSFYGASLVLIGIALTWMIYLAAYSARFNGSVRDVLRWSFVLMVIHPLRALEVFAVLAAGVVLSLSLPFVALIAPAGIFWCASILIEKVFLLHLRPEDAEAEAARQEDDQQGGNAK